MIRARKEDGFSLLEALIGVVIMGVLGTAALRSTHNAGQSVVTVRHMEESQRVMSAMLQEFIHSTQQPVKKGSISTMDGAVEWQLKITPIQLADITAVEVFSMKYKLATGHQQSLTMWRPALPATDSRF
ncbi:type II secretion system protein [Halodesulfovibrio sp.]|jgi:prepilin-type N-terminal cleavage/methylation domain-containing protein|uniref:type II secretion system protein n=1 Tax=Halodesulfovibrio sp. TaxID=1912772 RepID=UPI0025EB74AC|nr:prepilin-type N-terminal cleavage/methylation domain-containing protein [Halodesulfovibrio sp.]MCT4535228.1 prepilin-type N-terminal cleavage/methylation domain-containing protein [Halodesulfovibrio sp.]MCT4625426.1 prepilin-type N-terminal cleavage/methylation domain-containing protein [Halodesulfovibrio sp.]